MVEFCISKEAFERIDQETVIPHIMGYAFTQNASGGGTKRFSPVEDYAIDDSPVIRSFILQQLLSRYEGTCFLFKFPNNSDESEQAEEVSAK